MDENTITLLLIDDEAEYVNVAHQLMRPFQNKTFELIWGRDAQQARQLLKTNPKIDLVLMNYYLSGKNGLELTQEMFRENIAVPIILITAKRDFRLAVDALKYGVEDYLVKEEIVDTLLPRTILNVLERSHLKKRINETAKDEIITQQRAEAIQELIVTMCHEFNNPLAAIKISTDILSRQKISEEDKQLLSTLDKNISILEDQIIKLRDLKLVTQTS